jgi:hypothetical protein
MKLLDDARMYARFAFGLRKFLKTRITLDEARAIVRANLAQREANFLRVLKRGVYGYRLSPYRPLLEWAGCELGDVERLCRTEGLTHTLRTLREAGVYVSFDEFKGRQPIERGGRVFPVRARDFDNPFTKSSYVGESGGSTGSGTRVSHDLEHMAARLPIRLLGEQFHGIASMPRAIWRGILPNAVGVNNMIASGVLGNVPRKWFSPLMARDRKPSLKYRLANEYIIRMCRLYGVPVPSPERVPLDRADIIVRWMEETLRDEGSCHVSSGVSLSLRIAVAAKELGVDLTGAVLSGGGEPPTEAKVKTITSTGARCLASYHFSEAGAVGLACTHPIDCNDQHLVTDHLEVFQYPRKVPGSDVTVDAFTLTTLLATAPKLLLNVEIDDYGVIENRSCGCPWEELGFTKHVREIRSYRKLTGGGMTLVGSEMERILDEVLPAAFGGSPQDYQLYEEEDEQGFTRRSLIVSPSVSIDDESAVIRTVLESLGKSSDSADGARALWTQSHSLRVKRMKPVWTNRGKLMPLHLASRSKAAVENAEAQD